jgi:hypothetical protein
MARQRKPPQLHIIEGTHRKDRHGRLPATAAFREPLGGPPADWLPKAKMLWHEVANMLPAGVAAKSDRVVFEVLIRLLAKVREKPESLTPAAASQIRACAASFGMSPADRNRVCALPASGDDGIERKYFDDKSDKGPTS